MKIKNIMTTIKPKSAKIARHAITASFLFKSLERSPLRIYLILVRR
jgi:hypothetical protein